MATTTTTTPSYTFTEKKRLRKSFEGAPHRDAARAEGLGELRLAGQQSPARELAGTDAATELGGDLLVADPAHQPVAPRVAPRPSTSSMRLPNGSST